MIRWLLFVLISLTLEIEVRMRTKPWSRVEEAMHASLITRFAYDTSPFGKVIGLALERYSLILLTGGETRADVCCTRPFQRPFLPSLSVSMQHDDFGLANGGRVPYLVLSSPARPRQPLAMHHPIPHGY
jgi:hypothetical protein